MGEKYNARDTDFISFKVKNGKNKINDTNEKTKKRNICEEMALEYSEELSPDDFE
ncbi:hypothetical protein [Maledivibacter halophilus]|uniref:Uncharacterized protein n=1 Tax=Maledivibacter halophilus TaxID=36842 RepID=A0A1T5KLD6_9FIRM|nr:hypothetical protein [Maledivibacter halophilus]SKC64088.1 hypothetical protein SAMN02194393_01899 [Maledivibacter halophilus]